MEQSLSISHQKNHCQFCAQVYTCCLRVTPCHRMSQFQTLCAHIRGSYAHSSTHNHVPTPPTHFNIYTCSSSVHTLCHHEICGNDHILLKISTLNQNMKIYICTMIFKKFLVKLGCLKWFPLEVKCILHVAQYNCLTKLVNQQHTWL